MIIVEGPDCVGKSTFVAKLVGQLNSVNLPHVPLHLSKLPGSFHHVDDYLPLMSANVVWDRFYMSRVVYGYALNNQVVPSQIECDMLDAHARMHAAYTVVIIASDDALVTKCRNGTLTQMYTPEQITRVNEVYSQLISRAHPRRMDAHHCIVLAAADAWPSEEDVLDVVSGYRERRAACGVK